MSLKTRGWLPRRASRTRGFQAGSLVLAVCVLAALPAAGFAKGQGKASPQSAQADQLSVFSWWTGPGEAPRNLTQGRLQFPDGAAWSPNSLQLVIAARDGLWLVSRDGDVGSKPLTSGPDSTEPLMTPAWAP